MSDATLIAAKTDTEVTAEFIEVTPDLAEVWLEDTNIMNRVQRARALRRYKESVEDEEWEPLNGDTIVFDRLGYLTDGQHRLKTIADTGRTMECLVVRGVKPESRTTLDDGVRRTFADDLGMNGVPYAQQTETLMRRITLWDREGGLLNPKRVTYRRKTLSRAYPPHKGDILDVMQSTQRWMRKWPGSPSSMHFIYWLLVHRIGVDRQKADYFMSVVSIGSQNDVDQPMVKASQILSMRLHYAETGAWDRLNISGLEVYWLIQAWNNWQRQKVMHYMKPRNGYVNPYPLPIKEETE